MEKRFLEEQAIDLITDKFPCGICLSRPRCNMMRVCIDYANFVNEVADTYHLLCDEEKEGFFKLPESVRVTIHNLRANSIRLSFPGTNNFPKGAERFHLGQKYVGVKR